jgi:hypothetical protein
MTAYRAPDFQQRIASAKQARQDVLDRLRAKPAPTEAELTERRVAALRRDEAEAAQRAKRAAKKEAAKQSAFDAEAAKAAARAAEIVVVPEKSEAEKKAERDARYAARKNRK